MAGSAWDSDPVSTTLVADGGRQPGRLNVTRDAGLRPAPGSALSGRAIAERERMER
jgi:hypothetical protein